MRISHYVLLIPGILVININTFYDQKGLPAEDDSQYCNFVLNSGQKFKIEQCGVVQEMFQDMREIFIIGT